MNLNAEYQIYIEITDHLLALARTKNMAQFERVLALLDGMLLVAQFVINESDLDFLYESKDKIYEFQLEHLIK